MMIMLGDQSRWQANWWAYLPSYRRADTHHLRISTTAARWWSSHRRSAPILSCFRRGACVLKDRCSGRIGCFHCGAPLRRVRTVCRWRWGRTWRSLRTPAILGGGLTSRGGPKECIGIPSCVPLGCWASFRSNAQGFGTSPCRSRITSRLPLPCCVDSCRFRDGFGCLAVQLRWSLRSGPSRGRCSMRPCTSRNRTSRHISRTFCS